MPNMLYQTKSQRYLNMFNKSQREQLLDKYISAIGFGKDANFGEKAFSAYTESKIKGLEAFKDTKAEGETPVFTRLLNNKNRGEAIKKAIEKVFEVNKFDEAKNNYENELEKFKSFTKLRPPKYKGEDLIGSLKEIQVKARTAITTKQQEEKAGLIALSGTSEFNQNLTQAIHGVNYVVLKDNMLDDLDKAHENQLKDFDKSCSTACTDLLASNNVERSRWLFAAMLYDNGMMREKILELSQDNRSNTVINVKVNKTQINFSGVKPEDLGPIKTLTGRTLEPTPDGKGYTLKFGLRHTFSDKSADLKLLAFAIRASGYQAASFTVDVQPQEAALKLARQVYAAAVDAGFDPQKIPKEEKSADKITIIVNGTPMRADALFKGGHEGLLEDIQRRAERIRREEKALVDKGKDSDEYSDIRKLKRKLENFKPEVTKGAEANSEKKHDGQFNHSNTLN